MRGRLRAPEVELLYINLTKDSILELHAFHSPFCWRILTITILYSGFKKRYKKIRETRKLESILRILAFMLRNLG